MAESSRRYNLRDTRKKPQGVLLKRWELEYSKLISNENRRIPLETVKTAIRSAFEDGMFEQWRITLKCPLSGQRIKVPARYADCTHIECFDLESFLRMKTQKNLLVCPICQKEVQKPLANLRINQYIEIVLSTMPHAMQVELTPDGSFTEVYEEFVVVPNVINDEEPYIQDSSMLPLNVKQEALEDDDDYITLSDGEDDVMEEIAIVDMKPISLMPLNMDIKPKITSSSEPEHIYSGEDQEIQDQRNTAMQKANIYENDQNCSTGSATVIQFNVKTEPDVVDTSETEILGTVEIRKRKAPSEFGAHTSQISGAVAQQNVKSEGENNNLRQMTHAKTDLKSTPLTVSNGNKDPQNAEEGVLPEEGEIMDEEEKSASSADSDYQDSNCSKRHKEGSPVSKFPPSVAQYRRPAELTICKFFRNGFCRDGDECAYSHNAKDSHRRHALCKYYQRGYCKKGLSCMHLHGEYPCKAFHKGECSKEQCQYSHQPLNECTKPIFEQIMRDEELASHISLPPHPLRRKVLLPRPAPDPSSRDSKSLSDQSGYLPSPGVVMPVLSSGMPVTRVEEQAMAAMGTYGFFNPITPASTTTVHQMPQVTSGTYGSPSNVLVISAPSTIPARVQPPEIED